MHAYSLFHVRAKHNFLPLSHQTSPEWIMSPTNGSWKRVLHFDNLLLEESLSTIPDASFKLDGAFVLKCWWDAADSRLTWVYLVHTSASQQHLMQYAPEWNHGCQNRNLAHLWPWALTTIFLLIFYHFQNNHIWQSSCTIIAISSVFRYIGLY